ncbi:MAG: hypothetical protein E7447_05405 [Ruminococcaceae bacterium]|nr:hypothetical protein [Oscillospiraceae bacterium]
MIEYSKLAADNKSRIKEMTWMKGRFFIISAICILPVVLVLFLLGFIGKVSVAVQLGIYAATLDAVLIVMYGILYDKFTKAVNGNFESYEIDGKIDFTLERIAEDTLVFTRLTDEASFQIQKSDIKTVRTLKTIHVILLKDGRTIDLPKREDIDELIGHF